MKRRMIAFVLSALMATAVTGCGSTADDTAKNATPETKEETSSEAPAEDSATGEKLQVAMLTANITNENWQTLVAAVKELGASEYNMEVTSMDCESKPEVQNQQIESCIEAGYDAILIGPSDVKTLSATGKKAVEAGIPITSNDGYFDSCVSVVQADEFNNGYDLGKKAAEWVNENWADKEDINMLLLAHDFVDVVVQRADGMEAGFKENCKANVSLAGDVSPKSSSEAATMSESILEANTVDVVFAVTGDFLVGFESAAKNKDLTSDDVACFAMDPTPQSTKMLRDKNFIVYMNGWGSPTEKATKALDGVQKSLEVDLTQAFEPVTVNYEVTEIDASNVDQILKDYGWE